MLGSFYTPSSSSHEAALDPHQHHHHRRRHHHHNHHLPAAHMRQLLLTCADLISHSDHASARPLLSLLLSTSSPSGDSSDRLLHHFARSLSLRLNPSTPTTTVTTYDDLHSSYLALNQVTPFIRFSHLTANQAILEAVDGCPAIHILDLDPMQGVQWPPLMQALADRSPPPSLRITGVGADADTLRRTGDRLRLFASSLGLIFDFHPLTHLDPSSIPILPNEALAVNCVLSLHKLITADVGKASLRRLLHSIKAMNPRVVTVAEREANHNHPLFLDRFMEALDHYTAIFDSLEATLPPGSRERLMVEQVWCGREIDDIVAKEGEERQERHERFERWVETMTSCGFSIVPLSPFALSQAKLLLRLHYPSEGYQLHVYNNAFFLGWQSKALFSVSSWH